MASLRETIKSCLPYPVVKGIARLINKPFMSDLMPNERHVEYAWVLRNLKPGRILDYGYAGSYFAQVLCQFGDVVGADPRQTPLIKHPSFTHEWPLTSNHFNTVVCVSVLEHLEPPLYRWSDGLQKRLVSEGRLLLTVPFGRPRQFEEMRIVGAAELGKLKRVRDIEYFMRDDVACWDRTTAEAAEKTSSGKHAVRCIACVTLEKL